MTGTLLIQSVLAGVTQDMDAVVASAGRARTASGADQKTALQDIQTRADRSLKAVQTRIQQQLAAPAPQASPGTLPNSGQAGSGAWTVTVLSLAGFGLLAAGLFVLVTSVRRRLA